MLQQQYKKLLKSSNSSPCANIISTDSRGWDADCLKPGRCAEKWWLRSDCYRSGISTQGRARRNSVSSAPIQPHSGSRPSSQWRTLK